MVKKCVCMYVCESKRDCLAQQSFQSKPEYLNFKYSEGLGWQPQISSSAAQVCCCSNVSRINPFKASKKRNSSFWDAC